MDKGRMPSREQAPPGREQPMTVPTHHFVLNTPLQGPFPDNLEQAMFGMGCFWGAEKAFWNLPGVFSTAVGYAAGYTPNPGYEEVCTGLTGHNEVVLVVYDPREIPYQELLRVFWESHDPTQGMRQGNDRGTQYRSGIYFFDQKQQREAEASKDKYQRALQDKGLPAITTEIITAPRFYYGEGFHQQYLAKNPNGYCGLGGTGVCLSAG